MFVVSESGTAGFKASKSEMPGAAGLPSAAKQMPSYPALDSHLAFNDLNQPTDQNASPFHDLLDNLQVGGDVACGLREPSPEEGEPDRFEDLDMATGDLGGDLDWGEAFNN